MQIFQHRLEVPLIEQPWQLLPFGCVHEDDVGHHAELWAEYVETLQKTPYAWGIGLGDYFTFARTTYRKFVTSYKEDENSQLELDAMCRERAEEFYKKHLRPIQHKLLGLAEGNHHWEFMNRTTDTQYLCELAKIPYLGKASGHNLNLVETNPNHRSLVLQALVHHGDWSSGAQTIGGDLNSVERKSGAWDADIYLFAHTHRKIAWKDPIYGWSRNKVRGKELRIKERSRVYIRAGCFMRGYVSSCTTYAERKLLRPTDLGWVTLSIRYKKQYDPVDYKRRVKAGQDTKTASRKALGPSQHEFIVSY